MGRAEMTSFWAQVESVPHKYSRAEVGNVGLMIRGAGAEFPFAQNPL